MHMSFKLAALTSDKEVNATMQADMHTSMHTLKQLEVHSQDTTTTNCGSVLLSGKSSSVKKINLDQLHPLFRLGERVLVKAGPVPKGTSP